MKIALLLETERSSRRFRGGIIRYLAKGLVLPILLALSTGCAIWGEKPANVVDGFIRAIRARDYEGAVAEISPEVRDKMREVVSELTLQANGWASSKYDIVENDLNGDTAVISVEFIEGKTGGSGGEPVKFGSRQRLRFYMAKVGGRWYIDAISN